MNYFKKRRQRKEEELKHKVRCLIEKSTRPDFNRLGELIDLNGQSLGMRIAAIELMDLQIQIENARQIIKTQTENIILMGLCLSLRGEQMYDVLETVANPEATMEQKKARRGQLYAFEAKKMKQALAKELPDKSEKEINDIINGFYGIE